MAQRYARKLIRRESLLPKDVTKLTYVSLMLLPTHPRWPSKKKKPTFCVARGAISAKSKAELRSAAAPRWRVCGAIKQ